LDIILATSSACVCANRAKRSTSLSRAAVKVVACDPPSDLESASAFEGAVAFASVGVHCASSSSDATARGGRRPRPRPLFAWAPPRAPRARRRAPRDGDGDGGIARAVVDAADEAIAIARRAFAASERARVRRRRARASTLHPRRGGWVRVEAFVSSFVVARAPSTVRYGPPTCRLEECPPRCDSRGRTIAARARSSVENATATATATRGAQI
jgi:hypothetical protein